LLQEALQNWTKNISKEHGIGDRGMKGDAIRMKIDFIEKEMSVLQWKMKLNRKTEILSLQFHFFQREDFEMIF
jgi:hypothetical protein